MRENERVINGVIIGTGCIVISPTRELAMQTFGVLRELMKYHNHTYGLLMGGANRQTEAQKLSKGKNIIKCKIISATKDEVTYRQVF